MRVTVVQNEIKWGFKAENLESFSQLVEPLYGKTDLVVLPEMFSTGFAVNKPELAEDMQGEAFALVRKWAKEGDMAIASSIMTCEGSKHVNRGFFCTPDSLQTADKRHLFVGDEKVYFQSGNEFLITEFRGVRFRVLVCYDLRFPVWSRYTEENPYDVLIYTANWPKDRIFAWDTLLRARAIENQAFVVAANAVGRDSYKVYHNGHSCVLGTRGEDLLVFEEDEVAAKTVEIDLRFQEKVREKLPFLQDGDKFQIL